jgi:hypothetical protein
MGMVTGMVTGPTGTGTHTIGPIILLTARITTATMRRLRRRHLTITDRTGGLTTRARPSHKRWRKLGFAQQHVEDWGSAATECATSEMRQVSLGGQLLDQPAHLANRAAARDSKTVLGRGAATSRLVNRSRDGEQQQLLAPV